MSDGRMKRLERALHTLSRPRTFPTIEAALESMPAGMRRSYEHFEAEWGRIRTDAPGACAMVIDLAAWAGLTGYTTPEGLFLVQRLAHTMVEGRFEFDGCWMRGYRPLLLIEHVVVEDGRPVRMAISLPQHGEVKAA